MKKIELADGKEYTFILNVGVFKALKEQKGVDVMSGELGEIEDSDIVAFVAYEGLKAGARFEEVEFKLSEKQVALLITQVVSLEISVAIFEELNKSADYVKKHLGVDEKKS